MKTIINWRAFFILWIASILGTIAVLPYVLELESGALEQLNLPISLSALITLQVIQTGLIFALSPFLGLLLAKRIGLTTPILNSIAPDMTLFYKVRATLPI